ncbi:MAG: hypothetical protein P4N59_06345 [Negativicutes bacterium]|nr:hypothetical protein [Negativicutes bacterium]
MNGIFPLRPVDILKDPVRERTGFLVVCIARGIIMAAIGFSVKENTGLHHPGGEKAA